MGDYLTNIVKRSSATVGAIRPRPISVFAPVQTQESVDLASHQHENRTGRLPTPAEATPATMNARNHPMTGRQKIDIESPPPSDRISARRSSPLPVTEISARSTSEKRGYEQEQRSTASIRKTYVSEVEDRNGSTEKQTIDPHSLIQPRITKETNSPLESSSGPANVQENERRTTKTNGLAPSAEGRPDSPPFKPEIGRAKPGGSAGLYRSQRPVAPLFSGLETLLNGGKEKQTSEPPTIQVTIGRVEVRATKTAPAPGRPKPRQQVAMGLDEYMRKRNGGGR